MGPRRYVPQRGDLIWIQLNPRTGHEQSGHRPALVLSPASYNRKTGLCIICPATRKAKGYAFEVPVGGEDGVVLADHIRCVDWRARGARLIRQSEPATVAEVIARLEALLIDPEL